MKQDRWDGPTVTGALMVRVNADLRPRAPRLADFWRPASRPTTYRFVCEECIHWPDNVRTTEGPTVWLNGALLLTVTQDGFGIVGVGRPQHAKLKMRGVPLATPQPASLSHTLWKDIADEKTESDLRVEKHCVAVLDDEGNTL
ncbi:MAG: hypothetical protein JO223_18380, partial [Hyphomicrobiales bacterium]|nr:hypothetical protein [Hyphomicrobiales bacterium]